MSIFPEKDWYPLLVTFEYIGSLDGFYLLEPRDRSVKNRLTWKLILPITTRARQQILEF